MATASKLWDVLHKVAEKMPIFDELYDEVRETLDSGADLELPNQLTAENGAKGALIGEFFEEIEILVECPDEGDDCEEEDCDGTHHTITHKVPVSWTTIKAIWKSAVEHFEERREAEAADVQTSTTKESE
jgi:hypothetical protein